MISNGNSFTSPVVFATNSTNNPVTGISGKRNRMQFTQGDDNEFTFIKVPSFSHFLTSSQVIRTMKKTDKKAAADYNGDGVNDIFVNFPAGNWIIRSLVNSNGQMTPSMNYIGSGLQPVITNEVLSGDFNGDGKADIWSFENTGLKIYTLVGTSLEIIYNSYWPARKHFLTLGILMVMVKWICFYMAPEGMKQNMTGVNGRYDCRQEQILNRFIFRKRKTILRMI